jgi:hypothetical protein
MLGRAGPALAISAAETVVEPKLAGELTDISALAGANERDPDALATRASRSPDAVDVGLAIRGRIKVDHV